MQPVKGRCPSKRTVRIPGLFQDWVGPWGEWSDTKEAACKSAAQKFREMVTADNKCELECTEDKDKQCQDPDVSWDLTSTKCECERKIRWDGTRQLRCRTVIPQPGSVTVECVCKEKSTKPAVPAQQHHTFPPLGVRQDPVETL